MGELSWLRALVLETLRSSEPNKHSGSWVVPIEPWETEVVSSNLPGPPLLSPLLCLDQALAWVGQSLLPTEVLLQRTLGCDLQQ